VPKWQNIDRTPCETARTKAWGVFEYLAQLTSLSARADSDACGDIPFLRFDDGARKHFENWRETFIEVPIRSGELHPALESHLAKYRGLCPALALINHLADEGTGAVSEKAALRAIAFCQYLWSHALRAYDGNRDATAAKAILRHIKSGDLRDGFTARDIRRKEWSLLKDMEDISAGLATLVDRGWLASVSQNTDGRSKTVYRINPDPGRPSARSVGPCRCRADRPASLARCTHRCGQAARYRTR
jgi:hypothetical protein